MEKNENQNQQQPIVVNLPEGQNSLSIFKGVAPKQLDNLPPEKIDIYGNIYAPLRFLEKRVCDIDQHKAHILVKRDTLTIHLVINENDAYLIGNVVGSLKFSDIIQKLGINTDKQWRPETLGQFLKLHRTYFVNKDERMTVVNDLKSFTAKVNQDVQRETKENGNRGFAFRQSVDSNIPESFKLRVPIFSGMDPVEIEVETYANIDGTDVTISLQSAGAIDVTEDAKLNMVGSVIDDIKKVAPEIVIIEQ